MLFGHGKVFFCFYSIVFFVFVYRHHENSITLWKKRRNQWFQSKTGKYVWNSLKTHISIFIEHEFSLILLLFFSIYIEDGIFTTNCQLIESSYAYLIKKTKSYHSRKLVVLICDFSIIFRHNLKMLMFWFSIHQIRFVQHIFNRKMRKCRKCMITFDQNLKIAKR